MPPPPVTTPDAVTRLMWETALSVEEGPLAFAEQRVRELQQRILQALAEGAPDAEIERLLAELRNAMDDYMRALSNRLRSDPGELFDPTEALKAVGSRELTDLVDRISELLRTGSREHAQSLLTRLQEIMENISVGNLSDLTALAIQENQLTGAIPPELGNLVNLQYLWLQDNQLSGAIPPELGNLANLLQLRLEDNQLTGCVPDALAYVSDYCAP